MKIAMKIQMVVAITMIIIVTVIAAVGGMVGIKNANISLDKRGNMLARSLAHNSEYGTLIASKPMLEALIEGAMTEKDVVSCQILDQKGNVIAAKVRNAGTDPKREYTMPIMTLRSSTASEELGIITPGNQAGREEQIGTVLLGMSQSTIRNEVSRIITVVLIVLLASGLISFFVFTFILGNIIVRPIEILSAATRRVAEGDLEHQVPVRTNDELGSLAGAFNKMTHDLKETTVSKDYTDNIIRSMLSSLIVADQNGIIRSVNQAAEEMLRYKAADLIGKPLTMILGNKELIPYPAAGNGQNPDFPNSVETIYVTKDRRNIPVLFSSSVLRDKHNKLLGMVCVARDITDRKQAEDELQDNFERLQKVLTQTVTSLASAVEMRDPYTAGHQRRVTQLAIALAAAMNLPENNLQGLKMAAIIHDIGKLNVPAEILSRPSRLTASEYTLIKVHSEMGYKILKTIEFPWPVADIVYQHHERLDGSGYPKGLKGENLLLESKLLSLADVVEAMSSHRPYRPAFSMDITLDEIIRNAGVLYDPGAVSACVGLFQEKNFRFT